MNTPNNLQQMVDFVVHNYRDETNVEAFIKTSHDLNRKLYDDFIATFGVLPVEWLFVFRTAMAAQILATDPRQSLTAVAAFTGFEDYVFFEQCFVHLVGQTPNVFQSKAQAIGKIESDRREDSHHGFSDNLENLSSLLMNKVVAMMVPPSLDDGLDASE